MKTDPLKLLSTLLEVESVARKAGSARELHVAIANETARLIPHQQAIVLRAPLSGHLQAVSASDVTEIDRNAPYIVWAEQFARKAHSALPPDKVVAVFTPPTDPAEPEARTWALHAAPFAMGIRLDHSRGKGLLLLFRDTSFSEPEVAIAERLAEAYAHELARHVSTLDALRDRMQRDRRRLSWIALAILGCLLFPVRMTTTAPSEVVPANPAPVTAPFEGVVADVKVQPFDTVKEGDEVARLDDTVLSGELAMSLRTLEVARAEHLKTFQESFSCDECKVRLQVLQAVVQEKEVEAANYQAMLEKAVLRAPHSGTAVFKDRQEWLGKPVRTGEKIMVIAPHDQLLVRVYVPIEEVARYQPGQKARTILNHRPLSALSGTVARVAYNSIQSPDGYPAYSIDVVIQDAPDDLQPGYRGSTKIYGSRAPLAYFVLRQPVRWLRQYAGI